MVAENDISVPEHSFYYLYKKGHNKKINRSRIED